MAQDGAKESEDLTVKQTPRYLNYIMHGSHKIGPFDDRPSNEKLMSSVNKTDKHVSSAMHNDLGMPISVSSEQENEIARLIRNKYKIKKRTCCSFVEKASKDGKPNEDPICQCGYRKFQHSEEHRQLSNNTRWDDNNTELKATDAFGEMLFIGYNQRLAKYVRVDHNSRMPPVLELLTKQWHLEAPDLIISVTGGAKNFHMKPRLKELFRRGLMKAAESTGAWIVTGGMHAGVMKHVGEAVRDYTVAHGNKARVVALGIVPWGAVNNKEALVDEKLRGKWPAPYKANLMSQKRSSPLDPNHSHFILVDNGTQMVFGTEIEFRAKFEQAASRLKSETGIFSQEGAIIPSVCVVLEGGPGTLKTVKSAIESGTPAVIVEGSGRAADIIAYAYAHSGEEKVEVVDKLARKVQKTVSVVEDEVWDEVKRRIVKEFGEKNAENNLVMVRECLKKRDHITVFRQDGGSSGKDIDVAILRALLNVSTDDSIDQLRLALAWNQIDIAKSDIFGDDSNWQPEDLHEVMYEAILNNKPDFVKLFMENGVALTEFLTINRLLQLYNNVPQKELLHSLLRKTKNYKKRGRSKSDKGTIDLQDVSQLIASLMGDFYRPLYSRHAKYIQANPDELLESGQISRIPSLEDLNQPDVAVHSQPRFGWPSKVRDEDEVSIYSQYDREQNRESKELDFVEPARELFLWNVLMNRREMAVHFWDEGREGIAAALVAQKLLKGMHAQANDTELERQLTENAQHFEDLAVGVLSECYTLDENKTHKLLVRELPLFGESTIIALAVEADNKTFIAHAACQTLFTEIWMGKMTEENNEFILWSSIFVPVMIPFLVKFRTVADDQLKEKDTSTDVVPAGPEREKTLIETRQSTGNNPNSNEKKGVNELNWWQKIMHFYTSPVITFRCNCISFTAFLILFSIVMLTDFERRSVSPMEYFIIGYVATLILEELRQVVTDDSSSVTNKIRSYFKDPWNILDVITIVLFVVGQVLRFIDNDKCFIVARIILSLNLMTFCFRFLHIFSVHKRLGPKLVMIGSMMVDLLYFVVILLVFITAYGLAAQAILYPNADLEIQLVQSVLEKAYFQIYGELFLEEIKGELECTNNEDLWRNDTLPRCPEEEAQWIVPILMGVYILITNVLMLNLLIAMFSYTFSKIQDNTDLHWSFQRYHLTREYHDRPFLAPPLILCVHIFLVIRQCITCCRAMRVDNAFRKTFDPVEVRQVIIWENLNADEYLRRTEVDEQNTIDNKVKQTNERMESIAKQVDDIMENSFVMQNPEKESSNIKLPPVLEDRLDYLEQQLHRTSKALDWIVEIMASNFTKKDKPDLKSVEQIRQEAKDKKEKERKEKKEKMKDMLQLQLQLHQKSRDTSYPASKGETKYRFEVSDEMVPWSVEFNDYSPTEFTDSMVLKLCQQGKDFVDIELLSPPVNERSGKLNFNNYDEVYKVDRRTFVVNTKKERTYDVINGLPINPCGRTGMTGRGILFRWGPNHAGDPIVTRWKRDHHTGAILKDHGKRKLEFLAVQRSDNKEWAIPGGFRKDDGRGSIQQTLKGEFEEETQAIHLNTPSKDEKLAQLWAKGKKVYEGYADDPRNTDNAWIETTAVNFHDEDNLTQNLKLKAGDGASSVAWREISSRQQLYGVHLAILYQVAKAHNAAF